MKDPKFKKGLILTEHAAERLNERSGFTNLQFLKALYEKRYAKLGRKKIPDIPFLEWEELIARTSMSYSELKLNSHIEFDTFYYILIWSIIDEKFLIAVLKEEDVSIIITVLPSSYLKKYGEVRKDIASIKSKRRMLEERGAGKEAPNFKRYKMVVLWKSHDGKIQIKQTTLKDSIESYVGDNRFSRMALDLTGGIEPERIIVRSALDIDDIYFSDPSS